MLGKVFESDSPDEYINQCESCGCIHPDCQVFETDFQTSEHEGEMLCPDCYDEIAKEYAQKQYNQEPEINPDR